MAKVQIEPKGCRGCSLCVDTCPVDVFESPPGPPMATVVRQEDCIGCLSCHYVCPSQCIEVSDVELMRPFHRIEEHVAFVERFLQAKTAQSTLTKEDYDEAYRDVSARLLALADAVTETMGRGLKAVGRRAGVLAASHLPEMYEGKGVEDVLARMQHNFKSSFDFDFTLAGDTVSLTFHPCGLCKVVQNAGQTVGDAVLCKLFHDYWAGLLASFVGTAYGYEVPKTGDVCEMVLTPR